MPRSRKKNPPYTILALILGLAFLSSIYVVKLENLINFLLILLAATVAGTLFGLYLYQRRQALRQRLLTLSQIDQLSGPDFEKYVAGLMQRQGYRTQLTPASGDFGIDIIASKDGVRTAVQVKRYQANVGIAAVQEVSAGLKREHCQKCMVVTNSYFTPAAQELAKYNDCQLVNRDELINWIVEDQGTLARLPR
jgi:restriction system protein